MPALITSLIQLTVPHTLPSEGIPKALLIAELVAAGLFLIFALLFRKRFLKIICLCSTEICLFLACKQAFGSEALITDVMRWFTAAVACIVTVSIVNRINWSDLRDKSGTNR